MRILMLTIVLATSGCIPSGDSQKFGGSTAVEDASNSDQGNVTLDMSSQSDASINDDLGGQDADDSPDMAAPDMDVSTPDMCVPISNEDVCASATIECGAARLTDNCGEQRDIDCGNCSSNGTACSSGMCIENFCRDNNDNDNDGKEDCADEDCLGRRCSNQNASRTCQADGECQ